MDTVVTRLTGAWTDLTATWAASTPAAVDGEVITVQPADQGSSHAIEVIQAASEPDAGERGHLLAGCDTLALTVAGGRKHCARAYMGSATVVATGEGIAGERGGGAGGGGRTLGPEQNTFGDETTAERAAAEALRNAYTTANAAWLGEYNEDRQNLILLVWADGEVLQRRNVAGTAWEDAPELIVGPRGPQGPPSVGGGDLALVHSPAVSPAAARLAPVPGSARGSTAIDIGDLTAFTNVSAGTLQIGATTVQGIDLSAATTIQEVIASINSAIHGHLPLADYRLELFYNNPGAGGDGKFYGRLLRSGGDVEAVSGTLEPLLGLAAPAETTAHQAGSSPIVLPAPARGAWAHLAFRALGQSYTGAYWYFQSDFWSVGGGGSLSNYVAFNNSGGWQTQTFQTEDASAIVVGVAEAYNLTYFSILYDPATREVSWRAERGLPDSANWRPSIDTLTVLGR